MWMTHTGSECDPWILWHFVVLAVQGDSWPFDWPSFIADALKTDHAGPARVIMTYYLSA